MRLQLHVQPERKSCTTPFHVENMLFSGELILVMTETSFVLVTLCHANDV